jgi:hypothetical protein
MGPLKPPPWQDVAGLLNGSAMLYAAFFAVAVAASFLRRSSVLRYFRSHSLHRAVPLLARCEERLAEHAFSALVVRLAVSTSVCVVYVYVTYAGAISPVVRAYHVLLGLSLLVLYAYSVASSSYPITYVIGAEGVIEALSIASLLLARGNTWLNFSFLQAYIVMFRYYHVEPVLEIMFLQKTSPFRRQLARIIVEFLVFIYIFACGIQLFEVLGDPIESLTATTFELTLANAFYMTVVSLLTVGYGDL